VDRIQVQFTFPLSLFFLIIFVGVSGGRQIVKHLCPAETPHAVTDFIDKFLGDLLSRAEFVTVWTIEVSVWKLFVS